MPLLQAVHEKVDEIPEAFRELYTEKNGKYELTGIAGVKTQADIDRLQTALEKERNDHKAVKERFSVWGDLQYEDVVKKLDRFPELEAAAAGKLDETKIEEIVQNRVNGTLNSKLAPLDRELKTTKTALEQATAKVQEYETREIRRSIHDSVREAIIAAKVLPEATEDALLLAERVFEVVDGKVVTKDGVGVTPGLNAKLWLDSIAEKRPHWWPASQGGGGTGGAGGGTGGKNPFSKEHWNVTAQGQVIKEKGLEHAQQMAKMAGTTVGGGKPAK